MTNVPNLIIHDGLVAPGVLRVSTEALNYAREFVEAVTVMAMDRVFCLVDERLSFEQIRRCQCRGLCISWAGCRSVL